MTVLKCGDSERAQAAGNGALRLAQSIGVGGVVHGILLHACADALFVVAVIATVGVTGKVSVILDPTVKALVKVTVHDGIGLVLAVKLAGQLSVCPPLIVAPPL